MMAGWEVGGLRYARIKSISGIKNNNNNENICFLFSSCLAFRVGLGAGDWMVFSLWLFFVYM